MKTITASQLRREGWDEVLAYVRACRQPVGITRYGVVVAHLTPVPLVSDPTAGLLERVGKLSENPEKTTDKRSVPSGGG